MCLPFALALCLSTAVVTPDPFLFAYVPFTGCLCTQVRDLCFASTQGCSPTPGPCFSFLSTALIITTSNTDELRDKISAESEVTDSSSLHQILQCGAEWGRQGAGLSPKPGLVSLSGHLPTLHMLKDDLQEVLLYDFSNDRGHPSPCPS